MAAETDAHSVSGALWGTEGQSVWKEPSRGPLRRRRWETQCRHLSVEKSTPREGSYIRVSGIAHVFMLYYLNHCAKSRMSSTVCTAGTGELLNKETINNTITDKT